jgi:hypothetical protein
MLDVVFDFVVGTSSNPLAAAFPTPVLRISRLFVSRQSFATRGISPAAHDDSSSQVLFTQQCLRIRYVFLAPAHKRPQHVTQISSLCR